MKQKRISIEQYNKRINKILNSPKQVHEKLIDAINVCETVGLTKDKTEHQIQSEFFYFLKLNEHRDKRLQWIHAIPNGGKRSIGVAVKMKREGVKRGVADVFVPIPTFTQAKNDFNFVAGFYIEFKTQKGVRSPEQKAFEQHCIENRYKYEVHRSASDAMMSLGKYLSARFYF